MARTRGPKELGNGGLSSSARIPRPLMRSRRPGQAGGSLARSIHELDLIRHVPLVLMVLPWEMPCAATDVDLYDESDCGEKMHLELLADRSPLGLRPGVRPNVT